MAKSKLTLRQKRRIRQNQARARQRTGRSEPAEELLTSEDLGPEQSGVIVTRFGNQVDVLPMGFGRDDLTRRCYLRANLDNPVPGDEVVWQDGEPFGVVAALHPRRSLLSRPDNRGTPRPVAANISLIAVVIAPAPEPHGNLIDRYLVAAEHLAIKPLLLLNKLDLVAPDDRGIPALIAGYRDIGYDCLAVSAKTGSGMGELADFLRESTAVLVGQSGVGKSSIINALDPDARTRVGNLSEGVRKGRHTTTAATLFPLPKGGTIIDSPGIREFGLGNLNPGQVAQGFREFRPYLGNCRFRDCHHDDEPGCSLLKALRENRISPQRFASYQHIVQSLS